MMASMNQSTIRASALLVIAIAIIAGGYVYQNHQTAIVSNTALPTVGTSSDAVFSALAPGQTQPNTVSNTVVMPMSAEAIYTKPKNPKKLSFTAQLTSAEKTAIQASYDKSLAALAKDPMDFNAWIDVGTLNLMSENYAVAETVWQFASKQWPSNYVSHNNLGDLYMSYLRDYPKAEAEFRAAIVNKRDDPNPYKNLFTLYSETSYKPTNTAAEDVLKQGIAAVPKAIDMQVLLARWYKKLGRGADANAEYQIAIDNAGKYGLPELAKQIKTEAAK
jgi:tetratricopeptide (TPR) repeat protein